MASYVQVYAWNISPMRATYTAYPILSDLITLTLFSEQVIY
jgi:hypothetical protein